MKKISKFIINNKTKIAHQVPIKNIQNDLIRCPTGPNAPIPIIPTSTSNKPISSEENLVLLALSPFLFFFLAIYYQLHYNYKPYINLMQKETVKLH